ncbi:hypothetical protein CDAR_563681 [Caerostris darwini]|uniref:Uncharacterized protein n=1 Tax=Caerostris darwini TaxID=1538125 RepID=A0AAV4VEJ6_9ARAC|nr:hypothetical protein CDAR_563681 [Caerostris darwini]
MVFLGRKTVGISAIVIDPKKNLSPSKERCLISDGLKIISSQIVTQLARRPCHRKHHTNHHLALHGDSFPENPSTLSQTQPSRHPRQREISQLVELELIRSSRNLGSITSREPSYVSHVGNERV